VRAGQHGGLCSNQRMNVDLVTDKWPHADALKVIRRQEGGLSVEKAAARIDVSRSTWNAWEIGKQRPTLDSLKAIVEAFGCPPELVGYEAPRGWTLVPEAWVMQEFGDIAERLAAIESALCDDVGAVKSLEDQLATCFEKLRDNT
jgi:transcriptional regulator with XRE-family HTH domain